MGSLLTIYARLPENLPKPDDTMLICRGLEHIKELQHLSVSLMIEEGLVDSVSN